jgi:hypothetical protein
MVLDWGFNGTWFDRDMERIESLTRDEARRYRYARGRTNGTADGDEAEQAGGDGNLFVWQRSTSVHPHMVRRRGKKSDRWRLSRLESPW